MTSTAPIDWRELLTRAKKGDLQAKEELCRELCVILRLFVQHKLWWLSKQDQEDTLQDTMETLLKTLNRIHSNPLGWAYKILKNKIGEAIRKRRQIKNRLSMDHTNIDELIPLQQNELEEYLETHEQWQQIEKFLPLLREFCQWIIRAYLAGYTGRDMWRLATKAEPNLKKGAYHTRISRCVEKLTHLVQSQSGVD